MLLHYAKTFLPWLMIKLTGKPRYLPEIEWSSKSWTHNVFRVYELLFWRRYGIRREMSAALIDGKAYYVCHSMESVFALTEQYVREWLSSWKLVPFKVYIPVMQTPQGIPVFQSPYLFAIARDAAHAIANSGFSFTTTGSNRILVGIGWIATTGTLTAAYNSVSMTASPSSPLAFHSDNHYLWLLHAPTTGSNTFATTVATGSGTMFEGCASYTGAAQVSTVDAENTNTSASTTSITTSITVVANNSWAVSTVHSSDQAYTASTGVNTFASMDAGTYGDSNGALTSGSNSMTWTSSPAGNVAMMMLSFAPPAVGPANVKSWNGLAIASIKNFNGLATASVKNVNGLA